MTLTPDHLRQLVEGSGIAPDVVAQRVYRTSSGYSELKSLGFFPIPPDAQGLLMPLWTVEGKPAVHYLLKEQRTVQLHHYRPDTPDTDRDGNLQKYLFPLNARVVLDCHPRCQPALKDLSVPLWITEGEKKADALVSHGACVIDLLGVWAWNLPDWQHVALQGRDVRIVFDSDVTVNPKVKKALWGLKTFLQSAGAQVRTCTLPAPAGNKVGVDDFLLVHSLADLETLIAGRHATPPRRRAVRITARELKAKQLAPLTYVVDEILPAGCTLFTGKSKDGKSLAAYDLTVAVASGGKAFGRYDVTQGAVWYLALEDGERRAKERLQMIEDRLEEDLADEVLDQMLFTLWEAPRLGEGLEDDLTDWITHTPNARLIIIDILEKIRPPRKVNGNTYAEDYEPTAKLTRLAQEHNVAIVVIHHANKLNPADFRDSASGCMSLIGGADNFWSLSRMPMSEDATLKITGRDIRHEQDLAMQFKDGYWTALGDAKLVVMSRERQAVVDVLQAQARPLTPKQLASTLGKNVSTIKILLRKMLEVNIVFQPIDGHYALSPSYLSTTVNPVNPINPVNPVNPVNREEQDKEKQRDVVTPPAPIPEQGRGEGGPTVDGGFTRVYGGFTADKMTQPVENTELNGSTVYGFTEFTEFTGFTGFTGTSSDPVPLTPIPAPDCRVSLVGASDAELLASAPRRDAPCYHCRGTTFWYNAGNQPICSRCHPQPRERS